MEWYALEHGTCLSKACNGKRKPRCSNSFQCTKGDSHELLLLSLIPFPLLPLSFSRSLSPGVLSPLAMTQSFHILLLSLSLPLSLSLMLAGNNLLHFGQAIEGGERHLFFFSVSRLELFSLIFLLSLFFCMKRVNIESYLL